jgi:hypothetical protein
MTYRLFLILILSALLVTCKKDSSITQSEYFIKYYGNSGLDRGYDLKQTSDGGYIIIGTTTEGGKPYMNLIKTDNKGNKQWAQTYGEDGGSSEGRSVQITSDGGYILLGTYIASNNSKDMYLVKTSSGGDTIWTKKIGGSSDQEGNCVQNISGGYALAGSTTKAASNGNPIGIKDIWFVTVNNIGDTLRTTQYGGSGNDYPNYFVEGSGANYFLIGSTESFAIPGSGGVPSGSNIMVLTPDKGTPIGSDPHNEYGYLGDDYGSSIQELSTGSFIIVGTKTSTDFSVESKNIYLSQVTSNLSESWTKVFGGTGNDFGKSIKITNDGGFIILGTYDNGGGNTDQYLIKTEANGNEQWHQSYGGAEADDCEAVIQTADGGYAFIGYSSFGGDENICLVKVTSEGKLQK